MTYSMVVLIPAYDCQEELDHTLKALQNTPPVDVLVIDDGSSPPLNISGRGAPHNVELLRNNMNIGLALSLRRGIEALAGRGVTYVARLDAGDIALPGRFAKQMRFLDDHPEVAIVGSAVDVVDERGKRLYVFRPPLASKDIRRQILFRTCLMHPAVMMRVQAVMSVGNYRKVGCEDLDLFVRLVNNFEAANVEDILTRYVVHSQSYSTKRRRQYLISALSICFAHGHMFSIGFWGGVAKLLLFMFVSRKWTEGAKAAVWSLRHGQSERRPNPPRIP